MTDFYIPPCRYKAGDLFQVLRNNGGIGNLWGLGFYDFMDDDLIRFKEMRMVKTGSILMYVCPIHSDWRRSVFHKFLYDGGTTYQITRHIESRMQEL